MKRIAMVVEGLGDRKAFPSVVAKTGDLLNDPICVCHIVEGGEWPSLKRVGELERNCLLAAKKGDPHEILVAIDLDDLCAKQEYEQAQNRVSSLSDRLGLPVSIVFCVREFETWLLEGYAEIVINSPDIIWKEPSISIEMTRVRGAKGQFERLCGVSYRQSIDQVKFAKRLDLKSLFSKSRSYQKFTKTLTGLSYEEIQVLLD